MPGPLIDDSDEPIATINVIPFVDVVLVLLVIFMVTMAFAPKTPESGQDLNLPKGSRTTTTTLPPNEIRVAMDRNQALTVNNQSCTLSDLAGRIEGYHQQNPNAVVVVYADKGITYGQFMPVLNEASRSNLLVTLAYTVPAPSTTTAQ